MTRYVCFLRAINVGGRRVTMDQLQDVFESLEFTGVETFLASGNVSFLTNHTDTDELEATLTAQLSSALGFGTTSFIRALGVLGQIVQHQAFEQAILDEAQALNVAFLHQPLESDQHEALRAFNSDVDTFASHNCEIYWACRVKQSHSAFSGKTLEQAIGRPATFRSLKALRRMVAKWGE